MKIDLPNFSGIAPIYEPRKLPDGFATDLLDCKIEGGDVRPLYAVAGDGVSYGSSDVSKLFRGYYQGTGQWLVWRAPLVVDVEQSPIPHDTYGRVYWTQVTPSQLNSTTFDNRPRCAGFGAQAALTQAAIDGNSASVIRVLGVPQPLTAPTTTETPAVSSCVPSALSQTSPVHATVPSHPFKEGDLVIVKTIAGTAPTTPANMSEINGLQFRLGKVTPTGFDLLDSDGAHYSAFTTSASASISRVYEDSDLVDRSYVFTLVSAWGEEGAPSPPSTVTTYKFDSKVNVVCSVLPTAPYSQVTTVRLYRTEAGASGQTNFFFVKDFVTPGGIDAGATVTVIDDVDDASLGDEIPTVDFAVAPNGMQGLVALPNGFFAGFKGNTVYFSEPYQPHAWPDKYTKTTNSDIVGIAVFGQNIVIGTKSKPYIGTGTDPGSMSLAELDLYAPCLNKSGLVSIGTGVAYPSPDGLAVIVGGDPRVITTGYVNKRQWAALWSTNMDAIFWDRRYVAFSRDSKSTLIIELAESALNITKSSVQGRAPAINMDDDSLHFASKSGANFNTLSQFDPIAGTPMSTMKWTSKVFTMPYALSFGCGVIYAQTYPITLTLNYANLTSVNGQPGGEVTTFQTVTVAGPEPFRLPGGFLSREWQVAISFPPGTAGSWIERVIVAETMDDLRQ